MNQSDKTHQSISAPVQLMANICEYVFWSQ